MSRRRGNDGVEESPAPQGRVLGKSVEVTRRQVPQKANRLPREVRVKRQERTGLPVTGAAR